METVLAVRSTGGTSPAVSLPWGCCHLSVGPGHQELLQCSHAGLTGMGKTQVKGLHLHLLTIQIGSLFACRFVGIRGPSGCWFWQPSALLSRRRARPWSRIQRNSREGQGERDFRKSVLLLCAEQREGGVGTLGWFPWE